ncbi:MAG: 30S ribosomal protein S6 [bacterium]
MNKYEVVAIVKPSLSEDEAKAVQSRLSKQLSDEGAEISSDEFWGKKKMVYPIKKDDHGYYFLLKFSAEANIIKKVEEEWRRDNDVIRHLVVRLDKELTPSEGKLDLDDVDKKVKVEARGVTTKEQKVAEDKKLEKESKQESSSKPKVDMDKLDEKIDELLDKDLDV